MLHTKIGASNRLQESAIASDGLTGDIARLIGGEERRYRGEVLRAAQSARRDLRRPTTLQSQIHTRRSLTNDSEPRRQ